MASKKTPSNAGYFNQEMLSILKTGKVNAPKMSKTASKKSSGKKK